MPPAGSPIGGRDLAAWSRLWTRLGESEQELESLICSDIGRRHCQLAITGRAGLTLLLSALKSLSEPERNEVVLPSYTCYSVAASTVRAGLRPRVVDIERATLDFDLEQLGNTDFRRVVAIVTTNLYGLPGRLPTIARIAHDNGVFLVDDAAQSLGAKVGGRLSGAWGDAGLLSFDKGKPLAAIDGGALVTDSDDIALALRARMKDMPRPGILGAPERVAKLLAYVVFLRPSLYWMLNALPGLGLGETVYDDKFPLLRASRGLAALARAMWPRLSEFSTCRRANAERYLALMPNVPFLTPVRPVEGAEATYLRFPVLARDNALRDRLARDLRQAGIGATSSYPESIADIPALRDVLAGSTKADAGRAVARRILTLPTHPYVTPGDVERAINVVAACQTGMRGHSAGPGM